MQTDKEKIKIKSQRPTGNDSSLDFTGTDLEIPKVDELVDEINNLLKKIKPPQVKDPCLC